MTPNRDDIIRMARDAGFYVDEVARQHQPNCISGTYHMIDEPLERFAALVAAAKETELMDSMTIAYMDGYQKGKDAGAAAAHEACAKVLDEMAAQDKWTNYYGVAANAIRAMGEIK